MDADARAQLDMLRQQFAALEAENARLRLENTTLEAIGDGILVVERDGEIVRINDKLSVMWQLGDDQPTTHETIRDHIVRKIDFDKTGQAPEKILAPHRQQDDLDDLFLKDGRVFEQYAGVKRLDDEVIGYVWSFRDVTKRRTTERMMYRNQQFVQRLLRNMRVVLFTLDADGVITYSKGAGLARLGRGEGELVGINVFAAYEGHPILEDIQMALTGKHVRNTHDFNGIFHDVYMGPMLGEHGDLAGVIGVSVDVTDQKRAREALQMAGELREAKQLADQLRVEAEDANLAKSTFLANMSHELRTPLNSIIGFSQFLVNDPALNHEQHEYMDLIMRSSEHLLSLINDILEMAKIESGKTQLHLADFDLIELLETLDSIYRAQAANSHLDFAIEIDEDLPRYLHGDRNKLRQILVNLLSNAIKFTDAGRVSLRAAQTEATDTLHHIHFEVEDTGSGIAADEIDALFEPFLQTSSGRDSITGTGLGLPISLEFAELMGGTIAVESIEGIGSIFRVALALPAAMDTLPNISDATKYIEGLAPGQDNPRILVVDDKWENRLMLVRMLQRAGLKVREASDGRQGVNQFEVWQPDLIWMDMRMPYMDGYEATRQIRASAAGDEVVIVALTASAFDHERDRVLAAGCDDFLAKPFREQDLFQLMKKHLNLEFVYADEVAAPEAPATKDTLLAKLPRPLLQELHQAAKRLSPKQVLAIAANIQQHDEAAAAVIEQHARDFDFNSIIKQIEEAL